MDTWRLMADAPRSSDSPILICLGETIPGYPDVRAGNFCDGDQAEELGYREFAKYGGWLVWNGSSDFFMVDVDEPIGWIPAPVCNTPDPEFATPCNAHGKTL